MPALNSYDYAVVRVVPRVEREEFINVGVILFCRTKRFLDVALEPDYGKILALMPELDLEPIKEQLEAFHLVARGGPAGGPIGRLPLAERFHWLVSPRSTVVQTSPVHSGLCSDPCATLDRLMAVMVRPVAP